MMGAWIGVVAGTLLAGAAAVADAALLARSPGGLRADAVPDSTGNAVRRDTALERAHRALAFARMLGYGVAGGAMAWALGAAEPTVDLHWGLMLLGAAAVVALAEALARTAGDWLGAHRGVRLQGFTRSVELVLSPIVFLGEWVEGLVGEAVPALGDEDDRREEAAAQFREVLDSEAEVSHEERDLLRGVFDFGETTADEVMTPRVDMVGIERNTPWSQAIDRIRSARHSRVPVFDETIDEITGILYAKDLLGSVIADEEPDAGWLSLVRPPMFIPASKRIADLLREFRATGCHIAVVADEYGGTAGLVTIEDVLEELVGEIRDEYDEEERQIESEDGVRFWVTGRLTLDDLSEALAYEFQHDDVTTVGGLVMDLVGRVPRAGESLTIGPFRVVVERVVRRKIERVYFERVAGHMDDEDAD
ncbi:MAG: hemolysin family protein [Gemmatimonadaceae bacterium]